jgi:hypothetical protein
MKQFFVKCSIAFFLVFLISCKKKLTEINPYNLPAKDTITKYSRIDTINQTLSIYIPENLELLLNPNKGFVKYYNSEQHIYTSLSSTKYFRFDWSDIQPDSNAYNWNLIDSKIAECKIEGKKFAFGVMCANTNRSTNTPDNGKYVTPKWIFDNGAQSRLISATYWETGRTIKQVIPVWTDAVFLSRLHKFIKELGSRYNGNTDIAFIDIRSYGNWGEQHLSEIGGIEITSEQLKTQHIEVYKNAFPKTQLIIPWGDYLYNDTYLWAVNNKIGMRRDGIFKFSNGHELVIADGKSPSVFEYTAGYEWLKKEGFWKPENLLNFIEIGKPSYIQFDELMYEENSDLYIQIANRVGYHFVIKNIKTPIQIIKGQQFNFQLSILNKGVTNIYNNANLAIALLNSNDQVVQKIFLNTINPKAWGSDQLNTQNCQILFDDFVEGNYKLAIGLFNNQFTINPSVKFANKPNNSSGWTIILPSIKCRNN